ncbi:MAG: diguanylate cyclase [Chloroflexota bacterium]
MNPHAVVPLIASIAYVPLLVILGLNRPWNSRQRAFVLFLIPAFLWSVIDVFFRGDFFPEAQVMLVAAGICVVIWMVVQFHYLLASYYSPQWVTVPLAYLFVIATVALAIHGDIPKGVEHTPAGLHVEYGLSLFVIAILMLFAIGVRDMRHLISRSRVSSNPTERNQIAYLVLATASLIVFLFMSFTPAGGGFPFAHIGNLVNAGLLTYAVVAHHLLDVRVILRKSLGYLGIYVAGVATLLLLLSIAHFLLGFEPDVPTLAAAIGIGIPVTFLFLRFVREPWHRKVEETLTGRKYNYRTQLSQFIDKIHDVPSLEHFGRQLVTLLCLSTDCGRAYLLLPDPESGDFATHFRHPPVKDSSIADLTIRQDSPVLSWLKREARLLTRADLSILPEFQGLWSGEKEALTAARVEMLLPLLHRRELVALLAVGTKANQRLHTTEEVDLMYSVANQVAASMEKQYLYEQLEQRDRELRLINYLTGIVTSSLDIQGMFENFATELGKVSSLDFAILTSTEAEHLGVLALAGPVRPGGLSHSRVPLHGTATEWVAEHRKSLYEPDLKEHSACWPGPALREADLRSALHLPLVARDEVIGSLTIASREADAYDQTERRLLERLALQIGTPIENSRLYSRALQRSRVDELTGLFNRRHFEERLNEEMSRHARRGSAFSIVILDLDSFKTYNDMHGHPTGDRLLKRVGELLNTHIRTGDQAFRYGGDEFVLLLPETTCEEAQTVAERVKEHVGRQDAHTGVTCSMGLASYPSDAVMPRELVDVADTALYYAKMTGGNRVYLSSKLLTQPDLKIELGSDARSRGLSAVYALVAAVDARDHYTYGHSRRANTIAVALAEAIGLLPDDVSKVSSAALLHDIGKIGVPDRVLNKKGRLTDEEWETLKAHPRLGASIVSNIPDLIPCVGSILYHHERWDGTGYPEGLRGKQIPLGARILAIADAFAAMSSVRPYRVAHQTDKILEEIRRSAGTHFDPDLAEQLLKLIEAGAPIEATSS